MINLLTVVAGLSILSGAVAAPANGHSAPSATISNGVVIGVATSVPGCNDDVHKYLGIPFAKTPPERFSPPTDPASWKSPLQAVAFKPACMQEFVYPAASRSETMRLYNNPFGPAPAESEDCLYMNVFAPSSASASRASKHGLPVMVWIYGGSLNFGAGSLSLYDGSSFVANQNVILVTFNYRTNVFGFSGSPEVPFGKQNSGFLDQRKALAWVQANIKSFGGDPAKVTIFGESAGAFSVKQLVATHPKPVPFRGAIMQSTGEGASYAADSWTKLVNATGCTAAASQINCVRNVPAIQIKSIIEHNVIKFGPVVDNITHIPNTRQTFMDHTAAKVPLMIGSNSQEGRVVAYLAGLYGTNYTAEQLLESLLPNLPALHLAILALYPQSLKDNGYEFYSQVTTDYVMTCPTSLLSTTAAASGYDTWRYYYEASFPNTSPFPDAGSWHSSEISSIFGTYPTAGATQQQILVSQYAQSAWANFAKNPTKGPGWPKLLSNSGVEMGDIGANGTTGERTIPLSKVDYVCAVYNLLIGSGTI